MLPLLLALALALPPPGQDVHLLEGVEAQPLAAGVRRVNISLDTLDEDKFARVTRWGRLAQVIKGIDAAQKAGLRVKINTVALKGFNEDELFTLAEWCASRDMDLTFIEVMPMGDMGEEDRVGQFWSLNDVRARLAERTARNFDTGPVSKFLSQSLSRLFLAN